MPWGRRRSRAWGFTAAAAVVTLVGIVTSWGTRAGAQQPPPAVARQGAAAIDAALHEAEKAPVFRLREGSVLTRQPGTFVAVGDRIAFQLADSQEESLIVLENLALERVSRILEHTRGRQWQVTGSVTEYRGHNYLLIEHALVRARSSTNVAAAKP